MDALERARESWHWRGQARPPWATAPGPGRESVWDYPRPPRLEAEPRELRVLAGDVVLAGTRAGLRVCETASPPTFYLPLRDVRAELLRPAPGHSVCEWKGAAVYWSVRAGGPGIDGAVWSYPEPFEPYAALRDHLAFHPGRLACFVDGERAHPQPGGYYGGWITDELAGPFKGEPGTEGW